MHEAGVAAAVAHELRRAELDDGTRPMRLLVSGGHDRPDAFDAALRMHLAVQLPAFDLGRLVIEHQPAPAVCVTCLGEFLADGPDSACPACGGAALVPRTPEEIEIIWGDGPCA